MSLKNLTLSPRRVRPHRRKLHRSAKDRMPWQVVSRLTILSSAIIGLLLFASALWASATDVYITPDGSAQGACTSNPHPPSWFNTSANWGSGSNQIGPGTTVHLCGTFGASAGAGGYLRFQGSGTSGNPITLLLESGAVLTAPYWGTGAAIAGNGQSYLVVNGGTNGIIQASANGSGLANQQDGRGVDFSGSSNSEIKNLTISNIYVHSSVSDEAGQNTYGVYWTGGSNVNIDHLTVHDAKWCIQYSPPGNSTNSNVNIYSNTMYDCDHGGVIAGGNAGGVLNGATYHDNVMHDGANWDDAQNNNHHDGVHIFTVQSGAVITGLLVYNNYVYGDWGSNLNDPIFIEANSGGTDNGWVAFNNVLTISSNHVGVGMLCCDGNGVQVYNNTIIGSSPNVGPGIHLTGTGVRVENNIVSTVSGATQLDGSGSIAAWDYNNYFNIGGSGWSWHGTALGSLQSWQSACGCDAHAITGNPNLSSTYSPNPGSPVISAGADLASLGISPLDSDKAGNARPSGSTMWDLGAFESGTSAQRPNSPTALTVTVH